MARRTYRRWWRERLTGTSELPCDCPWAVPMFQIESYTRNCQACDRKFRIVVQVQTQTKEAEDG